MVRISHIVLCLLITGFIIGCIEQFNLHSEQNQKLLVVDGKLTQKKIPHQLKLSYSESIGSFRTSPVSHATVKLYDGQGNSEPYYEEADGTYVLYGYLLHIEPGKSYYLEILTAEDNLYRSYPQVMPEVVKPEKLHFDLEFKEELSDMGIPVTKNYISISLDTPIKIDGHDCYFIWRADEAYSFTEDFCSPLFPPKVCYIQRILEPDNITIFSSEGLSAKFLRDQPILSKEIFPTWEFFEKHFYNIRQYSITPEAFRYWEAVKKIAQPTGSIFDTPPGPIQGNIYNVNDPAEEVLGYFEVSAVDTIRTFTSAADLEPLAIMDRCPEFGSRRYADQACCNCLWLPDSYTERPNYWAQAER